jgi:hypothetical protein
MMKLSIAVLAVLTFAACAPGEAAETTTTSTTEPAPSTTLPPTATTSTLGRAIGGQLVKLDLQTLEPVPRLDPIPMSFNSWSLMSDDGSRMVIFEYAGDLLEAMTSIDVENWEEVGPFEADAHSARLVHEERLYMYDNVSGEVMALNLDTGDQATLGKWRTGVWMWDDLHVTPSGLLTGLGTASSDEVEGVDRYSVFLLDPTSGETTEIAVGPIERIKDETGVFDGEYEIPEFDSPGVIWGGDLLFIVHADGPEVMVVNLETGNVENQVIDKTSWLDRVLAFWTPAAAAKGASIGTYSSAGLSPDGRYLFISGNRYDVTEDAEGQLVEESEALGLTVVDTETWQIMDQSDLPFQFVRNAGGAMLGVDTRSTSPWIDDVYVLSTDDRGTVSHLGPFTVEGGGCQLAAEPSRLICSEYVSDTVQTFTVVDLATLEVIPGPTIGVEDYLHDNGVLVDWSPFGS